MDNDFLPKDYEVPVSEGKFMKLKIGENRFRILTSAIIGNEGWTETKGGKPVRKHIDEPFAIDEIAPDTIRHFWAFGVWNAMAKKIQVLEITQKSIMNAIKALTNDEDWGDPKTYDITISAVGDGLDREYTTNPKPKSPVSPEVQKEWDKIEEKFDLGQMFIGGDPFGDEKK